MNNKLINKLIFIILIINILIFCINTTSFAIDTARYSAIYNSGIDGKVLNVGNDIIGIVQVAGVGIAIIMLIVNAVRFILAAPDQKAQIKGQLIIYTIGAFLLFAGTTIFSMIAHEAKNI
ncbi:MAG: hypothetical protein IJH39_02165 [Clostridia bacterium]|nr:hypothetical protein [Clostridia bacterium]